MSTTDWIAAIGSIATGVATLVAILALLYSIRTYNKDQEQQKAAEIRQNLGTLKNLSAQFSTLLIDGSVLIYGSSAITKEYHSRLTSTATSQEFWEYLNNDSGILLSIAVEGWYSSPQTATLGDMISRLEQAALSLSGLLLIFSYVVQLLRGIVDDAYSPMIFTSIFSTMAKNSEVPKFFRDHEKENNVNKLINALNMELQAEAAGYFVVRYYDAVKQLTLFIKELTDVLLDLEDSKLIKISKTESKSALAEPTRTGSMKLLLQGLKLYFSLENYNKLLELINTIEISISKEQASKNLETKIATRNSRKTAVSEVSSGSPDNNETIQRMLVHLKRKGIEDPDIDLFLAVMEKGSEDSVERVKAALSAGANPAVTIGQVLAKYHDQLQDFKNSA